MRLSQLLSQIVCSVILIDSIDPMYPWWSNSVPISRIFFLRGNCLDEIIWGVIGRHFNPYVFCIRKLSYPSSGPQPKCWSQSCFYWGPRVPSVWMCLAGFPVIFSGHLEAENGEKHHGPQRGWFGTSSFKKKVTAKVYGLNGCKSSKPTSSSRFKPPAAPHEPWPAAGSAR